MAHEEPATRSLVMNRARMLVGMFLVALSLTAAPAFAAPVQVDIAVRPAGYPAAPRYDEVLEAKVLARVNALRALYGLPTLRARARAGHSARPAASEASRENSFGYLRSTVAERLYEQGISRSDESGEINKFVREGNVDTLARQIVQGWLRNP